jgi:hypothetical protein
MAKTVGDQLFERLQQWGVRRVFGRRGRSQRDRAAAAAVNFDKRTVLFELDEPLKWSSREQAVPDGRPAFLMTPGTISIDQGDSRAITHEKESMPQHHRPEAMVGAVGIEPTTPPV